MSHEEVDGLVDQIHRAGQALIAALCEEERLSELACNQPEDEGLFEMWAQSRRAVEVCRRNYSDAVACCSHEEH